MSIRSNEIAPGPAIAPDVAIAYAHEHGVESWFYEHVVHKRTLQDRITSNAPLKEREADRFDRLTLLVDRATEAFQNEDKALSWLKTPKRRMGGNTPLQLSARERGFLQVLSDLNRISHGIYI